MRPPRPEGQSDHRRYLGQQDERGSRRPGLARASSGTLTYCAFPETQLAENADQQSARRSWGRSVAEPAWSVTSRTVSLAWNLAARPGTANGRNGMVDQALHEHAAALPVTSDTKTEAIT